MSLEQSLRERAAKLGVDRLTVTYDTIVRLMIEMDGREQYVNLGSDGEAVSIDAADGRPLFLIPSQERTQ